MLRIVAFVVIITVILIAGVIAWYAAHDTGTVKVPPDVDPVSFRNHQHMARLLDRIITDDFISGVIPDNTKVEINVLLGEYFGKEIERGK